MITLYKNCFWTHCNKDGKAYKTFSIDIYHKINTEETRVLVLFISKNSKKNMIKKVYGKYDHKYTKMFL